MKKHMLSFFIVCIAISTAIIGVSAEEISLKRDLPVGGENLEYTEQKIDYDFEAAGISFFSMDEELVEEALYEYLVEAIETRNLTSFQAVIKDKIGNNVIVEKKGVYLGEFEIKKDSAGDVMIENAFRKVFYYNPQLLIDISWNAYHNDEYYIFLEVNYLFSDTQKEAEEKAKLENAINEYVKLAENVPDALGKLLVVHDAFAKNCRYATEELETGVNDDYIYVGYGALVNRFAVCQGNAIALSEIYERLGFETAFCRSEALKHIWNLVKINEKWYHLDETWNDSDMVLDDGTLLDGAFHDWFLISDAKNAATGHGLPSSWEIYGHTTDIVCSDKSFESGHIFNGEFVYNNANYGGWYGDISYKNGRYMVDLKMVHGIYEKEDGEKAVIGYIGDYPELYSKTIKSNGMLASEPYKTTSSTGVRAYGVSYLSTQNLGKTDIIYAKYENEKYVGKNGGTLFGSIGAARLVEVIFPREARKVMVWKSGTQQPVCEARVSE